MLKTTAHFYLYYCVEQIKIVDMDSMYNRQETDD